MRIRVLTSTFGAIVVSGLAVAAQPPAPSAATAQDAQKITVSGCVQKESAVLERSAMAGNVGMGDEYVLTEARLSSSAPAKEEAQATAEPQPPASASASESSSNFGKVYRATGDKESELQGYLGQRVEIAGSFKHPEDAAQEQSAVGTSGRTPAGALTTANTPEITIDSIKPVSGSCAPVK